MPENRQAGLIHRRARGGPRPGRPAHDPVTASARRNVLILSMCQALAMSGTVLVITVSALAGQMLAADKALATLPLALQYAATMGATIPASLFMGRVGRRVGFTVGQLVGVSAAALSAFAILAGQFWLLAAAGLLFGVHNAFWQYFRFAATERTGEAYRSRAISYVLAGGLIAAFVGPELAKWGRDLIEPATFAGSFALVVALCVASIVLLQFIDIPRPSPAQRRESGRPLAEIVRQPVFVVAALAGMVGYGVMVLLMTATPLAMVAHAFHFHDAAFVIQWHVVGMFAPSFFTGHLIRRFGVLRIILAGVAFNAACMTINLSGAGLIHFWGALVLLGMGWNFMFIGGTTLLTEAYAPTERAKTQAVNDFLVFGTVAAASFSSGALQNTLGWEAVNAAMALPVLAAFAATLWLTLVRRRTSPA